MLISVEKVSKNYTEKTLLNEVSLFLNEGDKIGVIGVNGTGKSTLLKIIAGIDHADSGKVIFSAGTTVCYLPQNPVFDHDNSILAEVIRQAGEAAEYEAKSILTRLGFTDLEQNVANLSGGQRKRVAIAAALLTPCQVLVLDEPTNHLDNDMVLWLEGYLSKYKGAILMVTHDRYFLDRVTNKIVEIDKGSLYSYDANYTGFLEQKAMREENEIGTLRKNKSLYRTELAWMMQGAKARGTKSRERKERFAELSQKIVTEKESKLEFSQMSSRLGKKTIEIQGLSKSFGEKVIVQNFDHILPRDARIGIVGKNGAGKSTLLNLICGRLEPDAGTVDTGDTVKLGYFSQESAEMDLNQKVIDYIKDVAEYIETPDGEFSASQMLERFLFTPDLQWNTIGRLSGGERRRLFLLNIIMQAPNIFVLDEPTNDLDIQTLTILEDYLENFAGAVLVVSHDRYFLDKVVDAIWEVGSGKVQEFLGGYSSYFEQCSSVLAEKKVKAEGEKQQKPKSQGKLKFSFKEKFEFEHIDDDIAKLETEIEVVDTEIAKNSSDFSKLQEFLDKKVTLEDQLAEKMDRWVYLNDLAERIENGE